MSARRALGRVDLAEGEMRGLDLGEGGLVLVARVGGALHAIDDVCNHAGCLLSQGRLEGARVLCPCHDMAFDVRTGVGEEPRLCDDQRAFRVVEEGGEAFLCAAAPGGRARPLRADRPPARGRGLSAARAAALRPALDRLAADVDAPARLRADPVELPRRYRDPADAEVAGLVAASLAYGRADVFKPRLEAVLAEMGPSPAAFADALAAAPRTRAFVTFRYRFNQPADVAALVASAGALRARHGSLGARFAALFAAASGAQEPLRAALAAFAAELREAPEARAALGRRPARGLQHLLPDASGPGASKRWNLYLRWMVRGPDAVDLGLWRGVPRAALVVPLDTHVARIARLLGLTRRRDLGWRTAAEITASLARLDPEDPVRYDFALCHLGMSGACPARRSAARCAACALAPHCPAGQRAGGSPR